MDDPFNPLDGTDIFGAHSKGNIHGTALVASTTADVPTALAAEQIAKADYEAYETTFRGTECANGTSSTGDIVNAACADHMVTLAALWMELNFCLYQTAKAESDCDTDYNNYIAQRNIIYEEDDVGSTTDNASLGCSFNKEVPIIGTHWPPTCTCASTNPNWPYQCLSPGTCRTGTTPAYPSTTCGYVGSNTEPVHSLFTAKEKTIYSVVNLYLGKFSFSCYSVIHIGLNDDSLTRSFKI